MGKNWEEHFADIIVDYFFADEELKELMMIPKDTKIIKFIEKYFIRAGFTSEVLTDEPVRIVYGSPMSRETASNGVMRNELSFDVYVNKDYEHNYSNNRLLYRGRAIANRIIHILTHGERYINSYRFWVISDVTDMACTTKGYTRVNVSFNYMKTI